MSSLSQVDSEHQASTATMSDGPDDSELSLTIAWFYNKFGVKKEAHIEASSSPAPEQPTVQDTCRVPMGAFPDSTPATSARALMDILALKTSLVTVIPSPQPGLLEAEDVVGEPQLRALFMKALTWYLERECINLRGAYVVLVGQEVGEPTHVNHPAVPVNTVRFLAAQQDVDVADASMDDAEFDAFMFHAAGFTPVGYGRDLRAQKGIMVVVSAMATFVLGFYFAQMCRTLLA